MRKRIIIILLTLVSFIGQSQNSNENILYIVDGIPIIEDPDKDDDELTENDIELLTVITDKNEIKKYTDLNVDKVISIITKPFAKRSDEIKAIPSTKQMQRKNGKWYLKNSTKPYSGKFIDYYSTGKIRGEGTFFNGILNGIRKMYYSNGNLSLERKYENGSAFGLYEEFYKDGTLKEFGEFLNGKEIGIWKMYHPNGQLKQITPFENGKMNGESIAYYSTGKIWVEEKFVNGVAQKDKQNDKFKKLYREGLQLDEIGKFKSSIKKYTKCIEIDSTSAGAYFARGTAKLNNMEFDEAIIDFNKTLEIEPYHKKAYGNRAFSLIRKYEFGNSRTLSKNSYVTILASKDKIEIPDNDLKRICRDLTKSSSLGVKNMMISKAKEKYCNE